MSYLVSQCYYSSADNSSVTCLWDNPTFGVIPFTAVPTDVEPYGVEIYNNAVAGEYGPVVSYADSHWYSVINNNEWNGHTYRLGQMMVSPTGVQPPNSTNQPIPPAPEQ